MIRIRNLAARHRAETRFRLYGLLAVVLGIAMLVFLFASIVIQARPAFRQHYIVLSVPTSTLQADLARIDYYDVVTTAFGALIPDNAPRRTRRAMNRALSLGAPSLAREQIEDQWPAMRENDAAMRLRVPLASDADSLLNGTRTPISEAQHAVLAWLTELKNAGQIEAGFAWSLFSATDSREPELAGLRGALVGSALTMFLVFVFSFPLGVGAAIYLQELAPKSWLTRFLEVNMNNLAAVPSIVFGILGLAIFINFFGLPRSAPLVGAMVLSLMTLPTIIISARASLAAVPDSLRQAALALGASRIQVIFHHTLPLAMPGILTGTIIGLAGAAGETAPLLMIGMLAFIVDVPTSFIDSATVLPAQIYIWADSPERAFRAKTSAAILVLLTFLFLMNLLAIYLRIRFRVKV